MRHVRAFGVAAVMALACAAARAETPLSTGFNIQGQLKQAGVPVTDTCAFEFTLWTDAVSVAPSDQVGPTLSFDGLGANPAPIDVVNGLFSALLDFGGDVFNGNERWVEIVTTCPVGGTPVVLAPRQRLSPTPYAVQTRGMFSSDAGRLGVGTNAPAAPFHVKDDGTFRGNHVAYFESTGDPSADGIAIQLANAHTNRDNNFITFYNADEIVTGRIEGFDLENGDWVVPPPFPDLNLVFDPGIRINDPRLWLDVGALPTARFTPGTLPTVNFTGGSLPTVNFTRGTLPSLSFSGGSLPSLTFSGGSLPSATFTRGTLPSLSFSGGSLPSLSFSRGTLPSASFSFSSGLTFHTGSLPSATFNSGTLPSATLNRGSLPRLVFNRGSLPTVTFSRGSLPTVTFNRGALPSLAFSGGSLPTLNFTPGVLPTLSFAGGRLPRITGDPITIGRFELSFDIPTKADLAALICWAHENGVSDFLGMHPIDAAIRGLKEAVTAACKDEGVTYGSKGADYAEWLPKLDPNDQFQIGQIVGVFGGKVSLKTKGAEQIMAISRAPVVVGNVQPEHEKSKFVTVGFMGQLPVVVRGMVRTGDYIVPSDLEDGTAVAIAPKELKLEHMGRTLGRAWSNSDNDVYSLITVAIGLDGYEAKVILENQRERMAEQDRRFVSLAGENARLKTQLDAMNATIATMLAAVRDLQETAQSQAACRVVAATVGARN